ncbi:MAG: 4Fe-4S binding protein, partial [Muribaculaceae bacterium]|nr:4Fe-4S binding protein [Muribaculaceae bacterium]
LNVTVIIGLLILTMLFGRIYCSVICPLGIMQDVFAWFGKKNKKNRYSYSPAKNILRYSILAIFIICAVLGISVIVTLLAPYSAYGRIASTLLAPIWAYANNLLALWSEHADNYMFYSKDVWMKGLLTISVALITLVTLGILAWRNGRTYCNTVCPVGSVLGLFAKKSLFRITIDTSKCVNCGLCAKNCKSACIDPKRHDIDMSRCVACLDCIDKCHTHAITYTCRPAKMAKISNDVKSRRNFMLISAAFGAGAVVKAQEKKVDGGLAVIVDKEVPERKTPIVPAGAQGLKNVSDHCTACQLCVSVCPNDVLRPSSDMDRFMQPEISYERGYCRPECTKCSDVCPVGAIVKITTEDKSSTKIGHAVWIKQNCVPLTDGVECGNCARHCPVGAIQMVASDVNDTESVKIPVVNDERCIGCGACENLCPSRPFSAIYVEGHKHHRTI